MVTEISIGELRRVLNEESKSEFKPVVFGDEDTKKINREAYSDIMKETEKYNGGLTKPKKKLGGGISATDNKGMHDLVYDNINKPFKEKVKSQMKGYVSKDAEERHKDDEFGNADFDNKGEIYTSAKEHAEAVKKGKDIASEIGLTGRELNKKDIEDNTETMAESKKIKMLSFKNTKFISEGHMLTMVPDEYKVEGKKFIMKDGKDTQYLVEWTSKEPNVSKKINKTLVNEEKERIKHLWEYKSPESKTSTPNFRLQEDKDFKNIVNKARSLMN